MRDVPFPASDQPDEAAQQALRGCDSEELFYGIGQNPDPAKARSCAYVERSAGDETVFERDTLPKATVAELADADQKLNASYQRVMKAASPHWGSVTKEGIRETERKWPKYRDAWAAFVKVKYPKRDLASVKIRVTRQRTDDLNAF